MNVGDRRHEVTNRVLTGAIAVLCVVASSLWLERMHSELSSGYSELRTTAQAWMCASMQELFDSHAWPVHMGAPETSHIALQDQQRR
jgi:hypothetical protein